MGVADMSELTREQVEAWVARGDCRAPWQIAKNPGPFCDEIARQLLAAMDREAALAAQLDAERRVSVWLAGCDEGCSLANELIGEICAIRFEQGVDPDSPEFFGEPEKATMRDRLIAAARQATGESEQT